MATGSDDAVAKRPIIFGEVLYDCFADGNAVLGGAPFNVAWHLQGFGLSPLFISRIGNDDLGEQVLSTMQRWGMDTQGIQLDAQHPTGSVKITLQDGQPSFDILNEQAYDFIDAAQALAACADVDAGLLYHGSLATRNATSAQALEQLRYQLPLPLFIDINLRPPWWQHASISALLQDADWAKLNDGELFDILQITPDHEMTASAQALSKQFKLGRLILTLGSEGALLVEQGKCLRHHADRVENLVDTVGAGDAFSAISILGIHHGWSSSQILNRASAFAARVCQMQGATSEDRSIYTSYKQAWEI